MAIMEDWGGLAADACGWCGVDGRLEGGSIRLVTLGGLPFLIIPVSREEVCFVSGSGRTIDCYR